MPSIARVVAVLLLVGGTSLASPIAGRENLLECIYDKSFKFACSSEQAAAMMSGAMSMPNGAPADFGAFLEDCCKKNPSSPASFFRKVDNPVAFDTAQLKNGEKADVKVDDNAPAPAIPGLANKKIGTGALEPNAQRKGVPQNEKAEVDVSGPNGQRKGTPSSLASTQLKDVNAPLPLAPEPVGAIEPNAQRKGVPQNEKAEVDVSESNGQRKGGSSLASTQLKDVNTPLPLAPEQVGAVEANGQRQGAPQNEKAKVDVSGPNGQRKGIPSSLASTQLKNVNNVKALSSSPLAATQGDEAQVDVKEPADSNRKAAAAASEGVDVKDPNARLPITSAQGNSANVDVEDPASGNRKAAAPASEEVDVKNNTPPTVPSLRLAGGNRKAAKSQNGVDVTETNKNDFPIDPAQREGENVKLDANRSAAANRKAITPAPKKAVGVQDPSVAALPLDLVQGNKGDSAELDVEENNTVSGNRKASPGSPVDVNKELMQADGASRKSGAANEVLEAEKCPCKA